MLAARNQNLKKIAIYNSIAKYEIHRNKSDTTSAKPVY